MHEVKEKLFAVGENCTFYGFLFSSHLNAPVDSRMIHAKQIRGKAIRCFPIIAPSGCHIDTLENRSGLAELHNNLFSLFFQTPS